MIINSILQSSRSNSIEILRAYSDYLTNMNMHIIQNQYTLLSHSTKEYKEKPRTTAIGKMKMDNIKTG